MKFLRKFFNFGSIRANVIMNILIFSVITTSLMYVFLIGKSNELKKISTDISKDIILQKMKNVNLVINENIINRLDNMKTGMNEIFITTDLLLKNAYKPEISSEELDKIDWNVQNKNGIQENYTMNRILLNGIPVISDNSYRQEILKDISKLGVDSASIYQFNKERNILVRIASTKVPGKTSIPVYSDNSLNTILSNVANGLNQTIFEEASYNISLKGFYPVRINDNVELVFVFENILTNSELLNIGKNIKTKLEYDYDLSFFFRKKDKVDFLTTDNPELASSIINNEILNNLTGSNKNSKNIFSQIKFSKNTISGSINKLDNLDLYTMVSTDSSKIINTVNNSIPPFSNLVKGIIITGILLIFAGLFISYFIGNRISSSLNATIDMMKSMAEGQGDLTKKLFVPATRCWEKTNCGQKDCRAFQNEHSRCFHDVGSFGASKKPCIHFRDKYTHCTECPVFKEAAPDEIFVLSAWYNSMVGLIRVLITKIFGNSKVLCESSEKITKSSQDIERETEIITEQITDISVSTKNILEDMNKISNSTEITTQAVHELTSSAEELSSTSTTMASAAEETSRNVSTVASSALQMSANVNSIAESIKQISGASQNMESSINEMNKKLEVVTTNCEMAKEVASSADDKAKETNQVMETLTNSSLEIGKIIDVINDIADQTNMLALNAMIEAAGAGEAGKGFAVVANEVKALASQTADATEKIAVQIETMQKETKQAVEAIIEFSRITSEINKTTNTITQSIDEQVAISDIISSTISDSVDSINEVSANAGELSSAAKDVARCIEEASSGVDELARGIMESSKVAQLVSKNCEETHGRVREIEKLTVHATDSTKEITGKVANIEDKISKFKGHTSEQNSLANDVSELSLQLKNIVDDFKY